MKQISSDIEINASPKRVWQVLTDFPATRPETAITTRTSSVLTGESRLCSLLTPETGARPGAPG